MSAAAVTWVLLQRDRGKCWYASQHSIFVQILPSGATVAHTGAFFSDDCTGVACDMFNRSLPGQICLKCASVVHQEDFVKRLRIARKRRGWRRRCKARHM